MARFIRSLGIRLRRWHIRVSRVAGVAGAVALTGSLLSGVSAGTALAAGGQSLLPAGGQSLLPAGGQFVAVPIVRVLDTRYGNGGVPVQPIPAGGTVTFPAAGVSSIPSNAGSVVLDINAINPGASGFLTVYDADAADPVRGWLR